MVAKDNTREKEAKNQGAGKKGTKDKKEKKQEKKKKEKWNNQSGEIDALFSQLNIPENIFLSKDELTDNKYDDSPKESNPDTKNGTKKTVKSSSEFSEKQEKLLLKQYDICSKIFMKVGDHANKTFSLYLGLSSIFSIFQGWNSLNMPNTDTRFFWLLWGVGIVINILWLISTFQGWNTIKHWPNLLKLIEHFFKNMYYPGVKREEVFMLFTTGSLLKCGFKVKKLQIVIPFLFIAIHFSWLFAKMLCGAE